MSRKYRYKFREQEMIVLFNIIFNTKLYPVYEELTQGCLGGSDG